MPRLECGVSVRGDRSLFAIPRTRQSRSKQRDRSVVFFNLWLLPAEINDRKREPVEFSTSVLPLALVVRKSPI